MTTQPAVLTPSVQLSNSAAAIYTAPALGQAVIKRAVFTNTDTVPHTITIHRVPSGGTALTSNLLVSGYRLTPGESYISNELSNMVLNGGEAIYALADTASQVNVTMSGFTL